MCSPRLRAQYTFVLSSAGVLLKTCDHLSLSCTTTHTHSSRSVQRCQHPPAAERSCWGGGPDPPSSRALLLGGGSAMSLVVQGGYRAVCGRSGHAGLDQRLSPYLVAPKARISWRTFLASILRMWHQLKACLPHRPVRARYSDFGYLLVWGYIADLSMVPRLRRGRLAGRALSHPYVLRGQKSS